MTWADAFWGVGMMFGMAALVWAYSKIRDEE